MAKCGAIYVLKSKYHGSNNQLIALAEIVGQGRTVKPVRCELVSRIKLLYPLYRWLCRSSTESSTAGGVVFWARRFLLQGECPSLKKEDMVIAKTPPFEAPLLMLAQGTGAKKIFVGSPRRFSENAFDCLISTPSTPADAASVRLSMLPTLLSYQDITAAEGAKDTKHGGGAESRPWCFFLGGNARGYSYSEADWRRICQQMISLSKQHSKKILVSTSPRTGADAEKIIKAMLGDQNEVESVFLWGENFEREGSPMLEYITVSDCLFVTEDSAGMISDALVSSRPVVSLRLKEDSFNPLSTPLAIYHAEKNHLLRLVVDEFDGVDIMHWQQDVFIPLQLGWREELTTQLSSI